jgi:hypothetical protein
VAADKESLRTSMLVHVQQCQCLLSDRITSIDEQVDAFDSGRHDMDDVYCCNIEKLLNEIWQLGERVYSARDEEEPTLKSEGEEGKCAFVSIYLLVFV